MSEQDNLQKADGTKELESSDQVIQNTKKESPEEPKEDPKELKIEEDDHGVNEIEASNAEDAEDEGNQERHIIEVKDYHSMSMEDLVDELSDLVKKEKVQAIKSHVDSIKKEFNEKFNHFLEEKKDEFVSDGGNAIDFHYSSPVKTRFNNALRNIKIN